MATILRVEGTKETVAPPPCGHWSLADLQAVVGGYIEVVRTIDGKFMVIDEEGKQKKKPLNKQATELYIWGRHDPIVGTAFLVDTRKEIGGPDDDEETAELEEV